MHQKVVWSLALLLSVGLAQAASASPTQTAPARIGIYTPFVLLKANEDRYTGTVEFSISDGEDSDISVELLDVWAADDGQRITLPLGSTPTSASNRLSVLPSIASYVPNGATQRVAFEVSIASRELLNAPLSTAVKFSLMPKSQPASGEPVKVLASAVAFVFATHQDFEVTDSGYAAKILNSHFMVNEVSETQELSERRGLKVIEDQLVMVSFETSNSGSLFAFVSHELTIRKSSFWVNPLSEEAVVFQTEVAESIFTPGQSRQREIPLTAQVVGTNRVLNLVSDWGSYEAVLKTTQHNGSSRTTESYESITFYVFPIRSAVLVLIALGFAVLLIQQSRRLKRANLQSC